MKLPKFSGKYSEYKQFIGILEQLVDSDNSLSNIEQLNPLLACLSDEALRTIKALQILDANYKKALASLKRVYDYLYLIFIETLAQLFEIPSITKPSASALRLIIDTASVIFDSLMSLGDGKDIVNAVIIHIVLSKVDPYTKYKYEEQLNYDELIKWSDCVKVLDRRYQHVSLG